MLSEVFKSFRPSRPATLVLFLLGCIFASLGTWQQRRAVEKLAIEQQHQNAPTLSLETAIARNSRFSTIEARGQYDANRHILLDNQIWQGQAGIYVFTPFFTTEGTAILVNRGWLPLSPDRRTLPRIPTPNDEVVLKGMLNTPPVPGRMLGSADRLGQVQWPQLVTYLNLPDISATLGTSLENWVVQLSKTEPDGFDGRDWQAVYLSSSRHQGYAFQWFALLTACVVMWVFLGLRKQTGIRK
jgi:surfeit locus 1 family protein